MFARVDTELARRIAEGLGLPAPKIKPEKSRGIRKSPALSQANTKMDSIRSRKVAILACNGVNAGEIEKMKASLASEKALAEIVSTDLGTIKSSEGKGMKVDKNFLTAASVLYDAVFVPGGRRSIEKLMSNGDAVHFTAEAFKHCKPVASVGEGFDLLKKAGVAEAIGVEGKSLKSGIMTIRGVVMTEKAQELPALCDMFIDAIAKHRFWEREKADMIPA
jgi:catalase